MDQDRDSPAPAAAEPLDQEDPAAATPVQMAGAAGFPVAVAVAWAVRDAEFVGCQDFFCAWTFCDRRLWLNSLCSRDGANSLGTIRVRHAIHTRYRALLVLFLRPSRIQRNSYLKSRGHLPRYRDRETECLGPR